MNCFSRVNAFSRKNSEAGFGLMSAVMGLAISGIVFLMMSTALTNQSKMAQSMDRREARRNLGRQLTSETIDCTEMLKSCKALIATPGAVTDVLFAGGKAHSFKADANGAVTSRDNHWLLKAQCYPDGMDEASLAWSAAYVNKRGEIVKDPLTRGSWKDVEASGGYDPLFAEGTDPVCGEGDDDHGAGAGMKFEKNFQKPKLVTDFTPDENTLKDVHHELNHKSIVSCTIPTMWPWTRTRTITCDQGARWRGNDQNPTRFAKSRRNTGEVAGNPIGNPETCRWIVIRDKNGAIPRFPQTARNRVYGINGKLMQGWARGYTAGSFCIGGVTYDSQVATEEQEGLTSSNQALLDDVFAMQPTNALVGTTHRLIATNGAIFALNPVDPTKPLKTGDMIISVLDENIAAAKALTPADALKVNKQSFSAAIKDQWTNGAPILRLRVREKKPNGAYSYWTTVKEFELPPNE